MLDHPPAGLQPINLCECHVAALLVFVIITLAFFDSRTSDEPNAECTKESLAYLSDNILLTAVNDSPADWN